MEGPDALPSVGNRAWQPRVVLVLPLLGPYFWTSFVAHNFMLSFLFISKP
jgi:hypothetical protein